MYIEHPPTEPLRSLPDSPSVLEPLLDIATASKILGLSVNTLRLWVCKRRIEFIKLGSRVMFRPEAIRALVNSSLRAPVDATDKTR